MTARLEIIPHVSELEANLGLECLQFSQGARLFWDGGRSCATQTSSQKAIGILLERMRQQNR